MSTPSAPSSVSLSQSLDALILPVSLAQTGAATIGQDGFRLLRLRSFARRFAVVNAWGAIGLFLVLLPHSWQPAMVAWLAALLGCVTFIQFQTRRELPKTATAAGIAQAMRSEDLYMLRLAGLGMLWALPGLILPLGTGAWAVAIPLTVVAVCVCTVPLLSTSRKAYAAFVLPMLLIESVSIIGLSPAGIRADPRLYFLIVTSLGVVLGSFYGANVATLRALARRSRYERAIAGQASILENGLVGIVALRDEWVIRANSYFSKLLGFDRDAMEAKSIRQLLAGPDDLRVLHELLREVHAPDSASTPRRSRELQLRRLDGDQIWCNVQAQHALDDVGRASTLLFFADISRRKNMEARLFESERAYRNLVDSCPSMIFATDAEGKYAFVSERGAEQVLGLPGTSLEGQPFWGLFAPETAAQSRAMFSAIEAGGSVRDQVCELKTPDGRQVFVSVTVSAMLDPKGRILGSQGAVTNVTERIVAQRALAQARDHVRDAVESIPGPMCLLDANERVQACNQAFREQFVKSGYLDPIGVTFENLLIGWVARGSSIPAEFGRDGKRWIAMRLQALRDVRSEIIHASDGRWLQRNIHATPNGGRVIMYTDVSELKKREAEAEQLAKIDPLTGLANRRTLDDRIERAIALARRMQQRTAIVMLDLDHFKRVNDMHGHAVGDAILTEVAARITAALRETDTVARYGGDEFVAVITSLKSDGDALMAANKLLGALQLPIQVGSESFQIGASLGIAMALRHGSDSATLLRRADGAMYRAKAMGRNCVVMCELDSLGKTLSLPTLPALEPIISGEFPVYRPALERKFGI